MVGVALQNESTFKSQNMYTKVLEAAKRRGDQHMLTRLDGVPNGDLVAVGARYHRQKACYAHYIGEQNIISCLNSSSGTNVYKLTVRYLIE